MRNRDPSPPHRTLGAVRYLPPVGQRDGLPQPHWLGHAVASPSYHWSQVRRMPGYGVCHFSLAGRGFLDRGRCLAPATIPAGTVVLYEPGEPACPYRGEPKPGSTWEFLAFFFCGTAAMTMFWDLVANHGRILPVPTSADWFKRLCELGCHQYGERRMDPADGADLVVRCLTGLMAEAEAQQVHTPGRDLTVQAEVWSTAHLHEGIGVAEVAAAVGVSREHLARTVMAVRGITVSILLDRLRVEAATARLRAGHENLIAIAKTVGLEPSTFHRTFRRVTGTTPDAYRRAGGAP